MPAFLSYPGVYIEEIPSGVRTITGVATSITAFLGRTKTGPINEPVMISSFGDYERQFGGLGTSYPISYAVRDFYLNGGSQAIIVRLYKDPRHAADATSSLTVDTLTLAASSPGEWGRKLRASIDVEVPAEMRTRLGLAPNDALFNLTVQIRQRHRAIPQPDGHRQRAPDRPGAEGRSRAWSRGKATGPTPRRR